MAEQKTVLVIDDEQDAVDIVEVMLSDIDDLKIVSANDGKAGIAKAREIVPDLIICDVQMPGQTGFDVFSVLRGDDATKGIPVIMLTGVTAKTGLQFSGKDMGAFLGVEPDAYIEKPVDPARLQKTVSKLLGI